MNALQKLLQELESESVPWEERSFNRNEMLIQPGMVENNIYIIMSGAIRAFYVSEFEEHTIRLAYQGSIFTALDSFISGKPTELYLQCIRESTARAIKKSAFMNFIHASSNRMMAYQKLLEEFVLQQMEREIDILTYSPTERYNRVLARSPRLFQEIPSKYIASYLRMTPETLSRLKKS